MGNFKLSKRGNQFSPNIMILSLGEINSTFWLKSQLYKDHSRMHQKRKKSPPHKSNEFNVKWCLLFDFSTHFWDNPKLPKYLCLHHMIASNYLAWKWLFSWNWSNNEKWTQTLHFLFLLWAFRSCVCMVIGKSSSSILV